MNRDRYKEHPEEVEEDFNDAREWEVRRAEAKAKKLKRYVYTADEAEGVNGLGL